MENEPKLQDNEPDEKTVFWAFSSYIFFLLPLISKYRKNQFVRFHFRQSVIWFLALLAAYILANLTIRTYLKTLIYAAVFILWCFGVGNALLGRQKRLPLIGWLAKK